MARGGKGGRMGAAPLSNEKATGRHRHGCQRASPRSTGVYFPTVRFSQRTHFDV